MGDSKTKTKKREAAITWGTPVPVGVGWQVISFNYFQSDKVYESRLEYKFHTSYAQCHTWYPSAAHDEPDAHTQWLTSSDAGSNRIAFAVGEWWALENAPNKTKGTKCMSPRIEWIVVLMACEASNRTEIANLKLACHAFRVVQRRRFCCRAPLLELLLPIATSAFAGAAHCTALHTFLAHSHSILCKFYRRHHRHRAHYFIAFWMGKSFYRRMKIKYCNL